MNAKAMPTSDDLISFMDSMPAGFEIGRMEAPDCYCAVSAERTAEGWKVTYHHNEEGYREDRLYDLDEYTVATFKDVLAHYQSPYRFRGPARDYGPDVDAPYEIARGLDDAYRAAEGQ